MSPEAEGKVPDKTPDPSTSEQEFTKLLKGEGLDDRGIKNVDDLVKEHGAAQRRIDNDRARFKEMQRMEDENASLRKQLDGKDEDDAAHAEFKDAGKPVQNLARDVRQLSKSSKETAVNLWLVRNSTRMEGVEVDDLMDVIRRHPYLKNAETTDQQLSGALAIFKDEKGDTARDDALRREGADRVLSGNRAVVEAGGTGAMKPGDAEDLAAKKKRILTEYSAWCMKNRNASKAVQVAEGDRVQALVDEINAQMA